MSIEQDPIDYEQILNQVGKNTETNTGEIDNTKLVNDGATKLVNDSATKLVNDGATNSVSDNATNVTTLEKSDPVSNEFNLVNEYTISENLFDESFKELENISTTN